MKYRARITNCVSHIKNIKKYSDAYFPHDMKDMWIEVDSEEEATEIEMMNRYFGQALKSYQRLIELILQK